MEAPDFWDNAEVSQKKMKELKSMKDDMETYQNLVTQKEDMETLIEMSYEENDPSMIEEIQEMLDEFQAQFDSIRVKTLLSGEYDGENAIIKLRLEAVQHFLDLRNHGRIIFLIAHLDQGFHIFHLCNQILIGLHVVLHAL